MIRQNRQNCLPRCQRGHRKSRSNGDGVRETGAAVPGKHQEGGLHQDPAEDRLPYFISRGGYIELNFVLLWRNSISRRGGKEGGAWTGYKEVPWGLSLFKFAPPPSLLKEQRHDIPSTDSENPSLLFILPIGHSEDALLKFQTQCHWEFMIQHQSANNTGLAPDGWRVHPEKLGAPWGHPKGTQRFTLLVLQQSVIFGRVPPKLTE